MFGGFFTSPLMRREWLFYRRHPLLPAVLIIAFWTLPYLWNHLRPSSMLILGYRDVRVEAVIGAILNPFGWVIALVAWWVFRRDWREGKAGEISATPISSSALYWSKAIPFTCVTIGAALIGLFPYAFSQTMDSMNMAAIRRYNVFTFWQLFELTYLPQVQVVVTECLFAPPVVAAFMLLRSDRGQTATCVIVPAFSLNSLHIIVFQLTMYTMIYLQVYFQLPRIGMYTSLLIYAIVWTIPIALIAHLLAAKRFKRLYQVE